MGWIHGPVCIGLVGCPVGLGMGWGGQDRGKDREVGCPLGLGVGWGSLESGARGGDLMSYCQRRPSLSHLQVPGASGLAPGLGYILEFLGSLGHTLGHLPGRWFQLPGGGS